MARMQRERGTKSSDKSEQAYGGPCIILSLDHLSYTI
jgi:hypothetical protein